MSALFTARLAEPRLRPHTGPRSQAENRRLSQCQARCLFVAQQAPNQRTIPESHYEIQVEPLEKTGRDARPAKRVIRRSLVGVQPAPRPESALAAIKAPLYSGFRPRALAAQDVPRCLPGRWPNASNRCKRAIELVPWKSYNQALSPHVVATGTRYRRFVPGLRWRTAAQIVDRDGG